LTTKVQDLRSQVVTLHDNADELDPRPSKAEGGSREIDPQVSLLNRTIKWYSTQFEHHEEEVAKLKLQLSQSNTSCNHSEQGNEELGAKFAQATSSQHSLQQDNDRLKRQVDELRVEIAKLKPDAEALPEANATIHELLGNDDPVEGEISIKSLMKRIESLGSSLETCRDALKKRVDEQ